MSCENIIRMSVSSTESKTYLLCRRNFIFCSALMCSDSTFYLLNRLQMALFYFYANVSFYFPTFLEFGCPNKVSPKSVYRPQISSRSAPACICNTFLISTSTQSAFTCSKLTIKTIEQGVKFVKS